MAVKFITLTTLGTGRELHINPRRVNYFSVVPPPSQQPSIWCGTVVRFNANDTVIVHESPEYIKTLLK